MKLSVIDQSLMRAADQAPQALQETLEIARLVEELGYHRFWVSEHHSSGFLAGSSPEVLLSAIGAATSSIRIGSGGVMLPHYSAYKVAENFALLSNLYPDRVDLGVGRAPGAEMSTAIALATDGRPKFERFVQLVDELQTFLYNPACKPRVSPPPVGRIPLWMLGSSPDSAVLAAREGLPYCIGLFINPQIDPRLIGYYKDRFTPKEHQSSPYGMIALSVLVTETDAQAKALSKANDVNMLQFFSRGGDAKFLPPEEALHVEFGPQELAFVRGMEAGRVIGTPEQVHARLTKMAEQFRADEIMVASNAYYLSDRVKSFKLLAEVFSLSGAKH